MYAIVMGRSGSTQKNSRFAESVHRESRNARYAFQFGSLPSNAVA